MKGFHKMKFKDGDVLVLKASSPLTGGQMASARESLGKWKLQHKLTIPILLVPYDFDLMVITKEERHGREASSDDGRG